jgi:hypothetical protein
MTEAGVDEIAGIDWNFNPNPYWLIAEIDGVALGCIQVAPGVPFGRLELLCIPKWLNKRHRSKIMLSLMGTGLATLKRMGAQFAIGMVDEGRGGYEQVLQNRGAVRLFSGSTFIKRL